MDGVIVYIRTEGWKELATAQLLQGDQVWSPMALVNGKLLIRDMSKLLCIEVGPTR
jgi:hypothetical protein